MERIMGLETAIAAKREQIRTGHENVDWLEEQLAGVQRADEALQELEAGDTALEACLEKIAEMMSRCPADGPGQGHCRKERTVTDRHRAAEGLRCRLEAGGTGTEKQD